MRRMPQNPLAVELSLFSSSGPKPSDRTMQVVRRYDLEKELEKDPRSVVVRLRELLRAEPSTDKIYSIAEIAYVSGKKVEAKKPDEAIEFYGIAVMHAYQYLFGDHFGRLRNPYDPEFRGSCDLYNGALEGAMRIARKRGGIRPGQTLHLQTCNHSLDVTIELHGRAWEDVDFERFEFVSDYEVNGLQNIYHTYGLGVPLIAVYSNRAVQRPVDRYYPPGLSLPMTAFLRMMPDHEEGCADHHAVLELHDPMASTDIEAANRRVPLETDLTTPLAYGLNQPELQNLDSSTEGLLRPDSLKVKGLFMLEPYQPGKIPVIMVHGLWSSPITWMEMFNDLRSSPELRSRYQFWFYLYPSGQPFWISAAELRHDLAEMRATLDPQHREPALDQMLLVGHSMGGLVSRLQTIESGDNFWKLVSDQPFDAVKANDETLRALAALFYFRPNPAIRRVIFIGTPHHGSSYASDTTRYFLNKLITLPTKLTSGAQQLKRDNPKLFRADNPIDIYTSLDSLSTKSPFLPVMLSSPRPEAVHYHSIIGKIPAGGFKGRVAGGGDGVVSYESAHLDNVDSELVIDADHLSVHRHSRSVLEVRRILLEHLDSLNRPRSGQPDFSPLITVKETDDPFAASPVEVSANPAGNSLRGAASPTTSR